MTPQLALEAVLKHGRVLPVDLPLHSETWGLQHAVGRLVRALSETEFCLDHAVLLRQCLRLMPDQSVVIDKISPIVQQHFETVGLRREIDGSIHAIPFLPPWLPIATSQGLDVPASASVLDDEPISAEGWLNELLGKRAWRSQAQRETAWNALTAPANSTVLVGLPTGAGKSLVYQVCAAFDRALTVVVVPTVALGLDQIKALQLTPLAQTHEPRLYTSDENAMMVLREVEARQCKLLITSPEAIVAGRLGGILRTHAREGWLNRLVIDEAHIVDSWGSSFRVEFQLLASHLRTWRSESPRGVRTLLLSATFGPQTPDLLRNLFASEGATWEQHIIQRLRPEIHYFSPGRPLDVYGYEETVIEAVMHLPRPAILYVTERKDAENWTALLRKAGLKRVECFHGTTSQTERARVLNAWREDRLDLVVATSAFGMGVDKADVRAVLRACFPENIDRYYQEIGRGGRDGAPSVAVTLWTAKDRAIGGGMGPRLLSDEKKIRDRWEAMWRNNIPDENGILYKVPVSVAPDYKLHERTYDESITWNKRLLLMMERAGLLKIVGLEIVPSEDQQNLTEWVTLEMKLGTTNLTAGLPGLLHHTRAQEVNALDDAKKRLDEILSNNFPACRVLREHYGRATYRTCGSCAACRLEPSERAGISPLVLRVRHASTHPRVDIVYGPSPNSKKEEGHVVIALRRVMREGLSCRFVSGEGFHERCRSMLDRACAQDASPYRLDLFTQDAAHSIRFDDVVICLHDRTIHPHADLLHTTGQLCAHWILGAQSDEGDAYWPFLHTNESRRYAGPEALNEWISSRLETRKYP